MIVSNHFAHVMLTEIHISTYKHNILIHSNSYAYGICINMDVRAIAFLF